MQRHEYLCHQEKILIAVSHTKTFVAREQIISAFPCEKCTSAFPRKKGLALRQRNTFPCEKGKVISAFSFEEDMSAFPFNKGLPLRLYKKK